MAMAHTTAIQLHVMAEQAVATTRLVSCAVSTRIANSALEHSFDCDKQYLMLPVPVQWCVGQAVW